MEHRSLQKEENIQELSGSIRREKAIVKERDNEIIVLQKRIQDLHEYLDEEIARRKATDIQDGGENPLGAAQQPELNETGQANTRQTDMDTVGVTGSNPNGDLRTGEMYQMMEAMMKIFQDERKHDRVERERDRNHEKPAKVRKDMKIELNTALLT